MSPFIAKNEWDARCYKCLDRVIYGKITGISQEWAHVPPHFFDHLLFTFK